MTEKNQDQPSRSLMFIQFLMGIGCVLAIALPFLRRTHGFERLDPRKKYLFVCNHVSLLDTILLGALCWRSGCYPILVLGDKKTWHASRFKKFLSNHIGFLLEREKINFDRIRELQLFGQKSRGFHLVVFPEGTRGDGVNVGPFQPGLHYIAQEARIPIVPVFIQNMHLVSTKKGRFHPIAGFQKVEVYFGEPIEAENYLPLERDEFMDFVREKVTALPQSQPATHLSPVPHRA
jgi:1-acyl-sn-glycerol-3-phosphate acyltransferase